MRMKVYFLILIFTAVSSAQATNKAVEELYAQVMAELAQANQIEAELANIERQMTQLRKARHQTELQKKAISARLSTLKLQMAPVERKLDAHKQTLSKMINAAWRLRDHSEMKLLFSVQELDGLARKQSYVTRYTTAYHDKVAGIFVQSQAAIDLKKQLATQQAALEESVITQEETQKALAEKKQLQSRLLKRLNDQIETGKEKLVKLNKNRDDLKRLIKQTQVSQANQPTTTRNIGTTEIFSGLQGRLDKPVSGKVIQHFGQARSQAGMLKGIVFDAYAGEPVKTVARGKVVFADWMNGFGNIVIVDHGEGYFSLYAYCGWFEVSVGQDVRTGDVLAYAGRTGGGHQDSVYFQLRHKEQALNPSLWLKQGDA